MPQSMRHSRRLTGDWRQIAVTNDPHHYSVVCSWLLFGVHHAHWTSGMSRNRV